MMGKMDEDRKKYLAEYKRTVLKRVPLEVRREFYETIQKCAADTGESVTGYIKKAVQMRIDAELAQQGPARPTPKVDPSNRNPFGI